MPLFDDRLRLLKASCVAGDKNRYIDSKSRIAYHKPPVNYLLSLLTSHYQFILMEMSQQLRKLVWKYPNPSGLSLSSFWKDYFCRGNPTFRFTSTARSPGILARKKHVVLVKVPCCGWKCQCLLLKPSCRAEACWKIHHLVQWFSQLSTFMASSGITCHVWFCLLKASWNIAPRPTAPFGW